MCKHVLHLLLQCQDALAQLCLFGPRVIQALAEACHLLPRAAEGQERRAVQAQAREMKRARCTGGYQVAVGLFTQMLCQVVAIGMQ